MESDSGGGFDILSLLVWGGGGLAWLGLMALALRGVRRASGWRRGVSFLLATLMVAVLVAPVWALVLLIPADLSSNDPQSGMGAGLGLLVGLVVAGVTMRRGRRAG